MIYIIFFAIGNTGSEEAGETAEKLATLNKKWRTLQQKARDRQTELEDALREAQRYLLKQIALCLPS